MPGESPEAPDSQALRRGAPQGSPTPRTLSRGSAKPGRRCRTPFGDERGDGPTVSRRNAHSSSPYGVASVASTAPAAQPAGATHARGPSRRRIQIVSSRPAPRCRAPTSQPPCAFAQNTISSGTQISRRVCPRSAARRSDISTQNRRPTGAAGGSCDARGRIAAIVRPPMNTSARPRAPSAFAFSTSRRHTAEIRATFKRINAVPPPAAYTSANNTSEAHS